MLLAVVAHGQSVSATLSGNVTDQQGAAISGAKIAVRNNATALRRERVTDNQGSFTVTELPPGTYVVLAEHDGFAPLEVTGVVLHASDERSLSITLKIGSVTQSVTVTSEAYTVNDSMAVGTDVDRQFVENIPLNGRSFQSLIDLVPGVQTNVTTSGDQGQFSVNGQRANANYFTVDGVSANVGTWNFDSLYGQAASGSLPATNIQGGFNGLVSLDDLQEFQILTSTFSPEYGRSPGAQVILVTRSGTNQFHGSLYEYLRNEAFDANDWFANSLGLPRAPLRLNDYGGTLGGAVRLPGYDGRDHTFFFFSYENQGLKLPQTLQSTVPSLAVRQSAIPSAAQVLNGFPKPNGVAQPPDGAAFNLDYGAPTNSYSTSFRVDHRFNDKYTIWGRFNYSPSNSNSLDSYDLAEVDTVGTDLQTYTFGSTQNLNSRWVNDIRGNYTRVAGSASAKITTLGGAVPIPTSVLWPGGQVPAQGYSIFSIANVGGTFNIGPTSGGEGLNVPHQYEALDNLSYLHGSHQFKFGVDFRLISTYIVTIPLGSNVIFDPSATVGPTGIELMNTGVDTYALYFNIPGETIHYKAFSAYVQDRWRVNPRLTLTYGTRWEVNPSPKTVAGEAPYTACCASNLSNLTLSAQGASYYPTTYHNFAPRLGAAYQIVTTPGRQLVVRSGAGIFYDLGQTGYFGNNSWPYGNFIFNVGTPFPVPTRYATFPAPNPVPSPSNPASITMTSTDYTLPRTYQYNLTLEQSLGNSQVLSVAYVGEWGSDLLRNEIYSDPNPDYSQVTEVTNNGFSSYNGLQVQFRRRLSHGFQSLVSYTYSHSIDNASSDSSVVIPAQFAKTTIDKGNSNFDVRHNLSGAFTYSIPNPTMGAVARALLHNWSLQGILLARSALPFDILESGYGIDPRFQAIARADLVPGQPLFLYRSTLPGGKEANPAAFTTLAPGETQGDLGRNSLRGFGLTQFDFSVIRRGKIKEAVTVEFRAEAFNIFNHPNFANPGSYPLYNNYVGSPMFGQAPAMFNVGLGGGSNAGGFSPLFATGGPRDLQLALRFEF
jgi:hypothetical protein